MHMKHLVFELLLISAVAVTLSAGAFGAVATTPDDDAPPRTQVVGGNPIILVSPTEIIEQGL